MGYNGKKELERIMNEKVSKATKPKTPKFSPINIKEFENYDYFFAGEREYNIYKEFVEREFPKSVKNGLKTLEELAKPELKNKLFKGSSSFINSAMNMALRGGGVYVVIQAQLEYVRQNNKLDLSNIYSDTGMCLRSDLGNNEGHSKNLIDQLHSRKALPVYLPVISYDLIKNGENLGFKIVDESKILNIPILNSTSKNFNDSDIDMRTGFPSKFTDVGNRIFWTTNLDLSRCYLGRVSDLGTGDSDLSYSSDNGRVVLAKPKEKKK